MSRELNPNQDDSFLEIGRILHDESYRREKKEIIAANMRIDLIKKTKGQIVIGEIKKSSRFIKSARMQLSFYLYRLKQKGILVTGELLIPKERKIIPVELTADIEDELKRTFHNIKEIIVQKQPPELVKNRYCSNCAYRDFCWV